MAKRCSECQSVAAKDVVLEKSGLRAALAAHPSPWNEPIGRNGIALDDFASKECGYFLQGLPWRPQYSGGTVSLVCFRR
eukprot:3348011-Prorocentrum_lima.AAC.1